MLVSATTCAVADPGGGGGGGGAGVRPPSRKTCYSSYSTHDDIAERLPILVGGVIVINVPAHRIFYIYKLLYYMYFGIFNYGRSLSGYTVYRFNTTEKSGSK